MTKQTSFSGQCPQCEGYNSRIRTEVITYKDGEGATKAESADVVSRTRIFLCNTCRHV
jgi:hypothetical protein